MFSSKAVQVFRQFSTTAVRRGHEYQGPGHVSLKNVIFFWLSISYKFEFVIHSSIRNMSMNILFQNNLS